MMKLYETLVYNNHAIIDGLVFDYEALIDVFDNGQVFVWVGDVSFFGHPLPSAMVSPWTEDKLKDHALEIYNQDLKGIQSK